MNLDEQRIRQIVREEIKAVMEERAVAEATAMIDYRKRKLQELTQIPELRQVALVALARLDYSFQSSLQQQE